MKPGKALIRAVIVLTGAAMAGLWAMKPSTALEAVPPADVESFRESWRVLDPITASNLAIYPVVSDLKADTSEFMTLDAGVASGEVRIAERGALENGMIRRRPTRRWPPVETDVVPSQYQGASVNELVLVNDSSRPLILLAGEVIAGGKQNRIIGTDLVVPPKSDPLPLTVFCVEHGRWSGSGMSFRSSGAIAHPAVRMEAQAKKSQAGVWDSVARLGEAYKVRSATSSYEDVVNSPQAKRALDEATSSIEAQYERELRDQLRGQAAVGVVVAIDGELVWSDVFPNRELFHKYWPKLLRSYVMEAEGRARDVKYAPSVKEARAFLLEDFGRMTVEVEPGTCRRTEIAGKGFRIVALEALGKPGDPGLMVHYNKMSREQPQG